MSSTDPMATSVLGVDSIERDTGHTVGHSTARHAGHARQAGPTDFAVSSRLIESGSRAMLVRRPALAGEIAIFIGLILVYDRVRNLAPLRVDAAVSHGWSIVRAEGPIAWEHAVNHWFARHDLLGAASVWYYQYLHLSSALAVLAYCYVRRFDLYRPIRNSLLVVNLVGFVVFALYPVAPPRLLPGGGYLDLVATAGYGTSHGALPMNAYAAMPSLHLAWAVCIAMVGVAMSRRTWVRTLFIAHPVLTGVIVVATGNHYILDIAAGVALALVASTVFGLGFASPVIRTKRPATDSVSSPTSDADDVSATSSQRFTLVSFHAHPDDETLFTGGTLARAAAEGHRVVVVVATLGEAGLTGEIDDADQHPQSLGDRRQHELTSALAELGVQRWEWLGYADSGRYGENASGTDCRPCFVAANREEAAQRLATILHDEQADVLTTYDAAGGYGHPDHVQVHDVGARAAQLAGTPTVLEATVDRGPALRLARLLRFVPRLPIELRPSTVSRSFTPSERITHRVDVSSYLDRKRAAMSAHVSQQSGGRGPRSLALYLRLPRPLFRQMFRIEWFVEVGRPADAPLLDDVFASNRRSHFSDGSVHDSAKVASDPRQHDCAGVGQ